MVTPKQYKQSVFWTVSSVIVALISAMAFLFSLVMLIALDGVWRWIWVAPALCFISMGAFFVLLVAKPIELSLDLDGFTLSGGWMRSPRFVAWGDVEPPFFSYYIERGQTVVGYNLIDSAKKTGRWADYKRRHFLPDATLPTVWRESAEQLAHDINAFRAEVSSIGG